MKWSSSSNSSLSSSGAGMVLNSTNNNCNTSNSSSSHNGIGIRSNASDRRSIFYTDATDMDLQKNYNHKKTTPPTMRTTNTPPSPRTPTTVRNTNTRFQSTKETIEMQQRKCENLISYFSAQIHSLNEELEHEKQWRDTHLAKIVKALLCFEAKLKNDQRQIRHQLYEKDTELNRLAREVVALREKYGVKDGDTIKIDDIAQYCPNCRKQYYHLDTKDVSIQVVKHELSCANGAEKDNAKKQMSSSEDGLGHVFSEARRSKRYMSKRTSGTFREYLKSRSIELPVDCETAINSDTNKETDENHLERKSQQSQDKLKSKESFLRKGSMRRSIKSGAVVKCDKMNGTLETSNGNVKNSSNEFMTNTNSNKMCDSTTTINKTKIVATSNSSFLKKYENEVTAPKTQFESTDDWYASASDMDDSDSAVSKPYGYNAVNPVLECVNQILLQQSMDGIMDNCTNSNETRTNANANTNTNATDSTPKDTNTLKKRVHFSTQNSMVQVPRSDSTGSTIYQEAISTITTANMCHNAKEQSILTYATIYGNEYEPIGSENNSSNHYVDMESKLEDDRPVMIEKSKTPPALPPKPANLMKLRQVLKIPLNSFMKQQQSQTNRQMDNESEPDYCSISDVHEAIKNVQIVADVHKNAEDDCSSHASEETKTDITDETFADVPKLPNVAAIISPKKESTMGKLISPDNYITKSSPSPPRAKMTHPINSVSNILSEINSHKSNSTLPNKNKISNDLDDNCKKNPNKMLTTIVESTKMQSQSTISTGSLQTKSLPIIKPNDKMLMPIQAEFDWYNLDVEYGKLMPANLHENGKDDYDKMDKKSESHTNNFGVEYNLDAEFSLTSSSMSSDNNSSIESSGSTIHFVPITIAEDDNKHEGGAPIRNQSKLHQMRHKKITNNKSDSNDVKGKSFDSFLEHTGLTAKPLPQKRKIFYNAPFV